MCSWFYLVEMEFVRLVEWFSVVDVVFDFDGDVLVMELSDDGEELFEEELDEGDVSVDELSDEDVLSDEDEESVSVTGSVVSSSGG